MAAIPDDGRRLFQAQLAAANATLYTALGVNTKGACIRTWTICNTDAAAAHPVTIDIVPAGGAAGVGVRKFAGAPIFAGETWVLDVQEDWLEPGATVQGFSDVANKVTVTAMGGVGS